MENQKDEIFQIKKTFIQFIPFSLLSKFHSGGAFILWASSHDAIQTMSSMTIYLLKISIHQRSIHLTLRVDIHFVYLFFSCFSLSSFFFSIAAFVFALFHFVALPKHLKHMNRGSTSMMEFMKNKLKKREEEEEDKNLFFVFDKCHFTLKWFFFSLQKRRKKTIQMHTHTRHTHREGVRGIERERWE